MIKWIWGYSKVEVERERVAANPMYPSFTTSSLYVLLLTLADVDMHVAHVAIHVYVYVCKDTSILLPLVILKIPHTAMN